MKLENVTMVIKTFERYGRLKTLLASIKKHYGSPRIIIVDDSKNFETIRGENTTYHLIPFDTGLSAGRNIAVSMVRTKYTLLLDDDFEFTEETNIGKLVEILDNTSLDLIGGNVILNGSPQQYCGNLEIDENRILHYKNELRGWNFEHKYATCDMILNFFLARTAILKACPWDERLKLGEHTAFFWKYKGKIKVGHTPNVSVNHNPGGYNKENSCFRDRNNVYFEDWLERENIKGIVNFNGRYLQSPKWKEKK